ncbi:glutamyl-tRNA reductase [Halanaerobium saccharolyticum]|uniref:Glutamyl-tRNA reductase n=1 Tax=Halanaerobium saccharolyticum TaxID=43595 RepID=A0A4R7Z6V4_9FIRM|nr:glutamyl-tRNA reductase [Halanaerobium saccharolyticum]RAK10600.1 glutamyl-tRNA reductase [Halanaerobium saccharolyticum]TDW06643.1 glutamyl-tRNA reductase [Halanaerobium saccharolyticum]TDX62278.1 glutamyl-tRNA reductase [Halanaerobium saccharolyticum]
MQLLVSGINHKTAPISIRDQLSQKTAEIKNELKKNLNKNVFKEFFVLSTCNRFEIYLYSEKEAEARNFLKKHIYKLLEKTLKGHFKYKINDLNDYLYQYHDLQAVEHLYRVAAGLDSLVKGEDQILAQIKKQFREYKEENLTASYLNQLCLEAIKVGKMVRTKTKINERAVSISYAAVELARDIFGSLNGEKVMILGAGETAELTLKNLLNYGVEGILVANRTYSNGEKLAAEYGGEVIHWEEFKDRVKEVDIIIASTAAPHTVLHKDDLLDTVEKNHGPMFLIDIALPRDIDQNVEELPGVHLYNLDDLKRVIDKNLNLRENEVTKAEAIIEDEKYNFQRWLRERRCVPLIREMRDDARGIKEKEVKRALHLLQNSELEAAEIIEQLGHRLLNKLLHQPTVGLKELAVENGNTRDDQLEAVKTIFAVGEEE